MRDVDYLYDVGALYSDAERWFGRSTFGQGAMRIAIPLWHQRAIRASGWRRHLIGLKLAVYGAVFGGTLKTLGFPVWFVLSILTLATLSATITAGVWKGALPDYGVARRGRRRMFSTLVKMEEALTITNRSLEVVLGALSRGEPPPALLRAQMEHATALLREAKEQLEEGPEWRRVFELVCTGIGGMTRMSTVMTEIQRMGPLLRRIGDLIAKVSKSSPGLWSNILTRLGGTSRAPRLESGDSESFEAAWLELHKLSLETVGVLKTIQDTKEAVAAELRIAA